MQNLHVNEDFLTGESSRIKKTLDVLNANVGVGDRTNMCFASSKVESGRGIGIVVETGINTEIGHIVDTVSRLKETNTPLEIKMRRFIKELSAFALISIVLVTIFMYIKGFEVEDIVSNITGISLSAIPIGIPILTTIALSISAHKLIKKRIVVKNIYSSEGLGACNIIATDKTGTLTVNEQTAKIIMFPDGSKFNITGEGYNAKGEVKLDKRNEFHNKHIEYMCQIGMINNTANLEKQGIDYIYNGDEIDLAFLALGLKYKIDKEELNRNFKVFRTNTV